MGALLLVEWPLPPGRRRAGLVERLEQGEIALFAEIHRALVDGMAASAH